MAVIVVQQDFKNSFKQRNVGKRKLRIIKKYLVIQETCQNKQGNFVAWILN
jgi:hypothetical protein